MFDPATPQIQFAVSGNGFAIGAISNPLSPLRNEAKAADREKAKMQPHSSAKS